VDILTKPEVIIKNLERKENTLYKRIHKIEGEIDVLDSQKFKQEMRIQKRIEAKQKRCKHNGGRRRTLNCRDDASFKWWLFCDKCGKEMGHEGEPDNTPYG